MFTDEYQTINAASEGIYKERGSRFLSFAYPVSNVESVKELIRQIKKEHYECNHHCYAFRLGADGSNSRCSDDREPAGTAGKPILGQLVANDLTDILIIVARYFGGSQLGKPGLINAYRSAANDAIKNSKIMIKTINVSFQLTIAYHLHNELMNTLRSEPVVIEHEEFSDPVILKIQIRKSRERALLDKLNNNQMLASHLIIN